MTEYKQIPAAKLRNLVERKWVNDSILMPIVLELDVKQWHLGVVFRCPHNFGHVLYGDAKAKELILCFFVSKIKLGMW